METLLIAVLTLLIASIFVNLFLFQSRMTNTKKNAAKFSKENILRTFLRDQKYKTQSAPNHQQRAHLTKSVIRLRSAYLAIEEKGIDKVINSPAYWDLINIKVSQLFSILTNQQNSYSLNEIKHKIRAIKSEIALSSDSQMATSVLQSLDRFQLACIESANNTKKLDHYNEKLTQLLLKISSRNYRQLGDKTGVQHTYLTQSKNLLQSMGNITDNNKNLKNLETFNDKEIERKIEKYQHTNEQIISQIEKHKGALNTIDKNLLATSENINVNTSNTELTSANSALDELSERIIDANQGEIKRLRDLVRNQRMTIIELEETLSKRKPKAQENTKLGEDDSNQYAEKNTSALKRSLIESEQCIAMLEDELNKFKTSNDALLIVPSEQKPANPLNDNHITFLRSTIDQLEGEVSQTKRMKKNHDLLMNFFKESVDGKSAEDISLLLYQALDDFNYSADLLVFTESRELDICTSGKTPVKKKNIIKNMLPGETNPTPEKGRLTFRMRNFGGFLEDRSGGQEEAKLSFIVDLLKTTDKIFDRTKDAQIARTQRRTIDECGNAIKHAACDIDEQLEAFTQKTLANLRDSFGQMQDVARARGLNATQIASFHALEKDAIKTLESDSTLRLQTRKRFLKLLKNLEEKTG